MSTTPPAPSSVEPSALARRKSERNPGIVYVLGAIAFVLGTSEFLVAGLLPVLAADLDVSIASAGLVVTVFAAGIIVGSPLMITVTGRLPRRTVLLGALVVFALGHVLAAWTASFGVLLAARFVTALAVGAFWSVGAVTAAASVPAHRATRATSVLIGGLTLATAVGIPLGTAAGQALGWRGPFWILAVLGAVSVLVVRSVVPHDTPDPAPGRASDRFGGLVRARVLLLFALAILFQAGLMAPYTYIAPVLTEHAGLASSAVPWVLVAFGVGAVAGTMLGGRFGDRWPHGTIAVVLVVMALDLAALTWVRNGVAAAVLVGVLGAVGYGPNAIILSQTVSAAGRSGAVAAACSTSSFNTGIVLSSLVAGSASETGLGFSGPPLVGLVCTVAALVPLLVLARRVPPRAGRR